ncbi:MAG: DoxX family protein [Verrucomicrobiales bacterium]|nr:DoxX family protein [Verrucomicrobiales bacterium]
MEYHSAPATPSPTETILHELGLLILRLTAALPLLYFQGWYQSFRAWDFVWNKKSWSLVDQFNELGFAFAGIFATTLILLCVILPLGVIFGLYTRFSAILLLILFAFMLIVPVEVSGSLNAQTLLLYAGLSLGLALTGGGMISFDRLFSRKQEL